MFMHRATDRAFETWTPRQRNSAPPSIALPTVYRNMVLLAAFSMTPTMCWPDRAMFRSQSLTAQPSSVGISQQPRAGGASGIVSS